MTEPMDIADFLLARIAEDEDWARLSTSPDYADGELDTPGWSVRVLAECASKRRLIAWAEDNGIRGPHHILFLMALPYAGHPDYDPEWAELS